MSTFVTATTTQILTVPGASPLAPAAVVTLIVLLVLHELTDGLEGPHFRQLAWSIRAAIAPLLIILAANAAAKIVEALH